MSNWTPTEAANAASDYFNSLPREQRAKLAPLLENYRQMGIAEALDHVDNAHTITTRTLKNRIAVIRKLHT